MWATEKLRRGAQRAGMQNGQSAPTEGSLAMARKTPRRPTSAPAVLDGLMTDDAGPRRKCTSCSRNLRLCYQLVYIYGSSYIIWLENEEAAAVPIVCIQFFTRSLRLYRLPRCMNSHMKLEINGANLDRLCAMATSGAQIRVMHAITHCAAGQTASLAPPATPPW